MSRILVALQYWHGDAEAAASLARLIADLCPAPKYANADILFAARNDADFDWQTIKQAARRFSQAFTFRAERKGNGWPQGPNILAADTWRHFVKQTRAGTWKYSGIFLIEPDGVPTSRDWLDRIVAEWDACPKEILGHFGTDARGRADHVNGNCVMAPRLAEADVRFPDCPREWSWDRYWRKLMLERGQVSRTIFSDYRLGTDDNPMRGEDHLFAARRNYLEGEPFHPAYVHGAKLWREAHELVRKRVLEA